MNPWINSAATYSVYGMILGSNPLSKVEIVSALNSFNLGHYQYHFNYPYCLSKYNPKVYLSAVQSVGSAWQMDTQNGQNWGEKSGSWPQICAKENG